MPSTNDPRYGLQSVHRAGQQSHHPRVIVELFSIFAFRIAHITISKLVDALSMHVSSPVLTAFVLVSIYALVDMERTRSRARYMYETMSGLVHGVQESAEDVVHELLDCTPHHQAPNRTSAETGHVLTVILWTRTTRSERRLRSSRRRRMVRAGIERERIRVSAGQRGLRVLRIGRATGGGGSRRGRSYGVDSIAGGGGVGSENETEERVMQISCPLGNKAQI